MSGVKGATHVYVCTTRDGVKIGASRNVRNRVKNLCGSLIREWHRPLDAQLIEYHALRLVGADPARGDEWFAVPVDDAVRAVEAAIAKAEAGMAPPSRKSQMRQRQAEIERERDARLARISDEIGKLNEQIVREGWQWDDAVKTFRKPSN